MFRSRWIRGCAALAASLALLGGTVSAEERSSGQTAKTPGDGSLPARPEPSSLDYNARTNRLRIGILLTDWL